MCEALEQLIDAIYADLERQDSVTERHGRMVLTPDATKNDGRAGLADWLRDYAPDGTISALWNECDDATTLARLSVLAGMDPRALCVALVGMARDACAWLPFARQGVVSQSLDVAE